MNIKKKLINYKYIYKFKINLYNLLIQKKKTCLKKIKTQKKK